MMTRGDSIDTQHEAQRRRPLIAGIGIAVAVTVASATVALERHTSTNQLATNGVARGATDDLASTTVPVATTSVTAPTVVDTTVPPTTAPPLLHAAASNGSLNIEITITPSTAATGHLFHFTTKGNDNSGGILATGGTFGDEHGSSLPSVNVDCTSGPTSAPTTSTRTWDEDHAYRRPGVYTFEAMLVSAGCGREQRRVSVTQKIVVASGPLLSNGPQQVVAKAIPEPTGGRDPSLIYLASEAYDDDGYVRELRVDWGDGTPADVLSFETSECKDPMDSWPRSDHGESMSHRYAASGPFTVTVSATSSGCDGRDVQTATAQQAVVAP